MQFGGDSCWLRTWDVCNGWGREITMAAQYLCRMTTCFSAPSSLLLSSPLFSPWITLIPASVLQQYVVSIDGNHPLIKWQMERGLDWTISSVAGESYRVDVSRALWSFLSLLCSVHSGRVSVIICWLRSGFFFSDWLDWATGELGSRKHPRHNWPTDKSQTCVERRLLHPQILLWRPLWLPTLVWLQQKNI